MNLNIKTTLVLIGLLASITSQSNANPTIIWASGVPLQANENAVIFPVAQATKDGSVNLVNTEIWYSWDNTNWTVFINNSSPNNSNPYYPNGDFIGGCVGLTQTGTFYLKATVTDANSHQATATTSVTVNSSTSALPSVIEANGSTYNYGPAWMVDTTDSNLQKMWWTTGYPGGGDCIGYATWPLGSTTPQTVLHYNSFGVALMSNPSVIKASFSYGGNTYSYAMYYTAGKTGQPNNIEETFSTDGVTWITPVSIITTQFPSAYADGYTIGLIESGVIRLSSSSYIMFYTDENTSGIANLYTQTSSDGVTWSGTPTAVTETGLSNFGATTASLGNCPSVAYNPADSCYYIAYAETSNNNTLDLYKIAASSISSGSWTSIWSLGSSNSIPMYYKSNPGILKDNNGDIPSGYSATVAFATSVNSGAPGDNIFASQLYYYSQ